MYIFQDSFDKYLLLLSRYESNFFYLQVNLFRSSHYVASSIYAKKNLINSVYIIMYTRDIF